MPPQVFSTLPSAANWTNSRIWRWRWRRFIADDANSCCTRTGNQSKFNHFSIIIESPLMTPYRFVNYLWDDAKAASLDPVGRLVYRSNILGSDQRVTNTGGGNTSSKLTEKDPLTGADVEVLWVKGSGGDLRTAGREFFSSLYQTKLI